MTAAARTFLAWVRQGIAAQVAQPASETASLPLRPSLQLAVGVNGQVGAALTVELHGPGELLGISPDQVVRTEPRQGAHDFEPHLLAAVELDRPDLPWVLTPAAADPGHGRLRPWLCLLVVERHGGAVLRSGPLGPLPVLTCPRAELPDLAESWAWAHAQLVGGTGDTPEGLLDQAEANVSRLLCPRRLDPATDYLACVVPTFEAGRLAGLGQDVTGTALAPAWTPGASGTVDLPVYYHWEFSTGLAGGFESLARRLQPRVLHELLGLRSIDVSHADPELPSLDQQHGVLGMVGAATPPDPASGGDVPQALRDGLRAVLAGGETGVAPPLYGSAQTGIATVPADGAQPGWLRELNLDPRHRAAAGLGVSVVQELQEQLMASAWNQVEAVERANQALRQGQLARSVSLALYDKHLAGGGGAGGAATSATGPATDRLVQLTEPAHARVRSAPGQGGTLSAEVGASAPTAATVSVPFRRAARPLGPVARRLGAEPAAPLPPPVGQVVSGDLVVTPPQPAPPGMVALDDVAGPEVQYRDITSRVVADATAWWAPPDPTSPQPPPGAGAIPPGLLSDLVLVRAHDAGSGFGPTWRSGHGLDFDGNPASWTDEPGASPYLTVPQYWQVAGAATFQVEQDPPTTPPRYVPALLVAYFDSSPGSPHQIAYRIALQLGADGTTVGGWTQQATLSSSIQGSILGGDVAVADISGDGKLDLLGLWMEQADQQHGGTVSAHYQIVWDVMGTPTASAPKDLLWTPPVAQGVGVAVADISGNTRPDLLVLWTDQQSGGGIAGHWRVGWSLDVQGNVTGGWSPTGSVPAGSSFGEQSRGAAVALADITGTGQPDLVVFHLAVSGGQKQGRYLVGWDLDPAGQPAGGWSGSRDVPGSWDDYWGDNPLIRGVGVGIGDLDPQRAQKLAAMGTAFQDAAMRQQDYLLDPVTLPPPPPPPPPFTVAALATRLRAALDPELTVPARVAARIRVGGSGALAAAPAADPLRPVLAGPQFPQAMYEPLRRLAQELLLPAADNVPPETVTLLAADPAFIESYMVGLNHELSRELLWRGYPTDGRGTWFRQFWDPRGAPAGGPVPPADIPEIHLWDPAKPLGQHATGVGADGMLMLLVRGQLVRRYPNLQVRAIPSDRVPGGSPPASPAGQWLEPGFRGTAEPDIAFYGFTLTAADARGDPLPGSTQRRPGYFFVFQEQPTEARFGLQPVPAPPAAPVWDGAPASWPQLSWTHLAGSAAGLAALRFVPAASPPAPLRGLRLDGAEWGFNGAHMAQITLQRPVRLAIHAKSMLDLFQGTAGGAHGA